MKLIVQAHGLAFGDKPVSPTELFSEEEIDIGEMTVLSKLVVKCRTSAGLEIELVGRDFSTSPLSPYSKKRRKEKNESIR